MSSIQIRKASFNDIPNIACIHVDAWLDTYRGIIPDEYLDQLTYQKRAEQHQKLMSDERKCLFVAEDEKEGVVGFVIGGDERGVLDDFDAEIYAIYLKKSFHGQGIGKKLILTIGQFLKSKHYKKCLVWVLTQNPNIYFYSKLGAQKVSNRHIEVAGKPLPEVGYGWDIQKQF